MSKDDLSCIVRAGLRVGLVDWRPHLAATSSAMDGADDKWPGIASAEIDPLAKQQVRRGLLLTVIVVITFGFGSWILLRWPGA